MVRIPVEGSEPTQPGAPEPRTVEAQSVPVPGATRLSAKQWCQARGIKPEHWGGFLEFCRSKHNGKFTANEWQHIWKLYRSDPIK